MSTSNSNGKPSGGGHRPVMAPMADKAETLREHILSKKEKLVGKPLEVVAEMETFADEIGLKMLFRRPKMQLAQNSLAEMEPKPKTLIEFGTFIGTSAIAWGATLRNYHGADARVYTFEFDPKMAAVARDMISLAGLEDVVTVLVGAGAESLRKLFEEGKIKQSEVDVAFIDHWEDYYLPDLQVCEELKLFHVGSLILADNVDIPGAPKYLAYVQQGGSGESGAVKFESKSLVADSGKTRGPKILEVTKVVAV